MPEDFKYYRLGFDIFHKRFSDLHRNLVRNKATLDQGKIYCKTRHFRCNQNLSTFGLGMCWVLHSARLPQDDSGDPLWFSFWGNFIELQAFETLHHLPELISAPACSHTLVSASSNSSALSSASPLEGPALPARPSTPSSLSVLPRLQGSAQTVTTMRETRLLTTCQAQRQV